MDAMIAFIAGLMIGGACGFILLALIIASGNDEDMK